MREQLIPFAQVIKFCKYQAQREGLTPNSSLAHTIVWYKLSALPARISEENAINSTTEQFISAKISGCTLKQGAKHTCHCVRASYSCKMRLRWCLVEYEQSSIEYVWLDRLPHTPVCKIESCKITQELRIRMKYAENFQFFIMHRSPANF